MLKDSQWASPGYLKGHNIRATRSNTVSGACSFSDDKMCKQSRLQMPKTHINRNLQLSGPVQSCEACHNLTEVQILDLA